MEIREKFVAEWKSNFSEVNPPDVDFSIDTLQTTLELYNHDCLLKKQELLKLEFVVNFLQKVVKEKSDVEEDSKINVHQAESESRKKVQGLDHVSENRPETEPSYSLTDGIQAIAKNAKTVITVGLTTAHIENSKPKNENIFANFKLRPAPKPPVHVGPVDNSGQGKFELKFDKQEMKENTGKTLDTFGKPLSGPRWSISSSSRSKSQSEGVSNKHESEKQAKPSVPPRVTSHLTYNSEQTKNIPANKMVKFSEKEPEISSRSSSTPNSPRLNKLKNNNLSDKATDESSDDISDIGKCIDELKEMKKQEELKSTATGLDSVNNQMMITGNVPINTNLTVDCNSDKIIETDKNNDIEEEDMMRRSNGMRISRNVDDMLKGTKYSELDFSGNKRELKSGNDKKSFLEQGKSMTYVQLSKNKRGRNKSAPDYENVSLDFILTKCNQSDESPSDSDENENYENVDTKRNPPILESDIDSVCDLIKQDKPMKPLVEADSEHDDGLYDNAMAPCDENDVTPTPESVSSTSSWTFVSGENVSYDSGGRDSVFIRPSDLPDGKVSHGEKDRVMKKNILIEENGFQNTHHAEKAKIEKPEDKERTRKLHMRQILVKGVLESEKTYLKILEQAYRVQKKAAEQYR
ncbi:hypothetical protein KUTeg_009462 [Tegillarca granosa]|uniref:DH domain-containing protein n=1 Tax=Tegillarca granosa TaxID=220873 RepID=A0ABQ9F417_TEGGR|nr:hypothetical protein KUTeg_009462 [Tegillarca granosa]